MIDPIISDQLNGARNLFEWTQLQKSASLIDGGGADTGGPNALPHGKHVWVPGDIGSLVFNPAVRKQGQPWDNLYMYDVRSKATLPCEYFSLELQVMYPSQADITANTAVEFELELCEKGLCYNMAWQMKPSATDGVPAWRWFDETVGKWNAAGGLPVPIARPSVFVTVMAHFVVNREMRTTTHDSISIDGSFYPVGAVHKPKQKWSSSTWYLHNAIQLDSDGKGTPGGIKIRNWNARGL